MAYDEMPDKILFHSCRIVYRNLSGRIDEYNERGDRSFAIVIEDPELADKLEEDGWRIKRKPPREEGDPDFVTLKVFVKYDYRPPKIYIQSGDVKTLLNEDQLNEVDFADITDVKVSVTPYRGKNSRDGKWTAYCRTMIVFVEEEDFADDFDDDEVPFD